MPSKKKTEPIRVPDFRLDMYFVEYGYEANFTLTAFNKKGEIIQQETGMQCRDFGGSYPIEDLTNEFADKIYKTIDKFQKTK